MEYKHRRNVQWERRIIYRDDLSTSFKKTLNSTLTVFRIESSPKRAINHIEFYKKIEKKSYVNKLSKAEENYTLRAKGVIIKKIVIKNFRSLVNIEIANTSSYCLLIGNNDSGKSNVLKALNLFFNGETEPNKPFNYNSDFSKNAVTPTKKANEIEIVLTILPPLSYKDFGEITWKKVWRHSGEVKDTKEYTDVNMRTGNGWQQKSYIPWWLNLLKYKYIPAIKGRNFFQELLSDLHDVLARDYETRFKEDASTLIKNINERTSSITETILGELDLKSIIQVPDDLKSLFSILDFETSKSEHAISLSSRGDGIKVRHMPAILSFINQQDRKNHHETIWGYEEPENNLEMKQAFNSANTFLRYSNDVQIMQTSHSPAFYSLAEKNPDKVNILYVNMAADEKTNIVPYSGDDTNLDQEMGILPYITPLIEKEIDCKEKMLKEQETIINNYKDIINELDKPCLYVEGETDKKIIMHAAKILGYEELFSSIKIISEGGAQKVADVTLAHIFNKKSLKCSAFFDYDAEGKQAYGRIINTADKKFTKAAQRVSVNFIPCPSRLNNKYDHMLEDLLDDKIFQCAIDNNWVTEKKFDQIENDFFSKKEYKERIKHTLGRYYYKVKDEHKIDIMNHALSHNDKILFNNFITIFENLKSFFI